MPRSALLVLLALALAPAPVLADDDDDSAVGDDDDSAATPDDAETYGFLCGVASPGAVTAPLGLALLAGGLLMLRRR